jgi:outer membrane protein assembly factor BamB
VSIALVLVLLLSTIAASGADADQGGSFDGRNGVAVLETETGRELWSARPADHLVGYFSAAPGNDVLVATEGACTDSLHARALVAFDAETGRRRWKVTDAGDALRTTHQLSTYFSAIVPVDAMGVVISAGETKTTAYRVENGSVAWSKSADDHSPLGVSNSLVFTVSRQPDSAGSFRALDRRTGRVRWESDGWTERFGIIAADARYVLVATGGLGGQPYTGPVTLVVLDARTGKEKGRFDAGKPKLFYFSDVALVKGLVVYADGRSIVGRRLPNGAQVWRRRFTGPESLELMGRSTDNATVFALGSGAGSRVTALDGATGRERWSRATERENFLSADAKTAVFGRWDPNHTMVGLDTTSGVQRWRRAAPSGLAPPGLGATDLTVNNADGRVAISNPCDTG